jgi:hypothetical protein
MDSFFRTLYTKRIFTDRYFKHRAIAFRINIGIFPLEASVNSGFIRKIEHNTLRHTGNF